MNTGSSKSPQTTAWRDLYKAALFELDESKFSQRIADAERALVERARENCFITAEIISKKSTPWTMPCTLCMPLGIHLGAAATHPAPAARQLRSPGPTGI